MVIKPDSLLDAEMTDVDQLAQARQSLAESNRWFKTLVASSSDMLIVLGHDGHLAYANPSAGKMFGYSSTSDTGSQIFDIIHPDDLAAAADMFVVALATSAPTEPVTLRFKTVSGKWRYIESVLTNCLDDPAVRGLVGNGHDVTDHIHLTRAMETLTRGNQVLFNAIDQSDLLSDVCRSIVDSSGFPLAWVALSPSEGSPLAPLACAGIVHDITELALDLSKVSDKDPVGRALSTVTPQVEDDLYALAPWVPWVASAVSFDLRSVVALPLRVSATETGVLVIYAYDTDSFGPAELISLGDLAKDLGFALARLNALYDLNRSQRNLTETEQRFRLAFEANTSPMIFTNLDDHIIDVNDAFCRLVGRTRAEVMDRNSTPFTHPDDFGITESNHQRMTSGNLDSLNYTKRYLRPDGQVVVVEVSKSRARDADGNTLYYVISERDITEQRSLTDQLTHQALHDPLTGLANRSLFEDRLTQALAAQNRGTGPSCAILLIDLDDFKGVNDTHGHLVGDQLLSALARRLSSVTRASDTLSRFGGDEFLYLATGISSMSEAASVAERLLSTFADPFDLGTVTLVQRASAGVVLARPGIDTVSSIIANADVALYESKRVAPGSFTRFEPQMHAVAADRFALCQELRKAIDDSLLEVHYQPIVAMDSSRVLGFEALARWTHPTRGPVSPSVFIPVAEHGGLILDLGDYVLSRALADAATWGDTKDAPYVTVNLSAHQFLDPGLFDKVSSALEKHSVSPSRLVLEITETTLMCDLALSRSLIESLSEIGVGLALDDFGTGYSSLSYLSMLNPRILKIDRSFIDPASPSARHDTLLEAIVTLGQSLGITVLAEGVETLAQAERLRSLNCELAQGYLYSPAVPVANATHMIGATLSPT